MTERKRGKGKIRVKAAIETAQPAAASSSASFAAAPAWLEERFEMTDGGLFKILAKEKKPGEDGKPEERVSKLYVCPPFTVEAMARDVKNGAWSFLISWSDADGVTHRELFPLSAITGDCAEVRAKFAGGGLLPSNILAARQALGEYLSVVRVAARARSVDTIGWHELARGMVIALQNVVYGEAAEVVIPPTIEDPPPFNTAGTLAEWGQHIASQCIGNSRLMLAVCCALAAPLLHLVNMPGFGVNLVGRSSSGKSTALLVGASVCGGTLKDGSNGYLRSWDGTVNGPEAVSAAHNDALLCIDEINVLDSKNAAAAPYIIANGRGKNRAMMRGGLGRTARWRTLFLSSGEVSLSSRIAEAGGEMRAGQEARLLDLPADAGKGFGLFETVRAELAADDPEAAGAEFAKVLSDATRKYYGTALRAFLAALTAEMKPNVADYTSQLRSRLNGISQQWLGEHPGAGGQVRSIATRFALIGLAGELATEMLIVPWSPGDATQAAKRCLDAHLDSRGTVGAREDTQAVNRVLSFISRHAEARFTPWNDARLDHEDAAPPTPERVTDDVAMPAGVRTPQRAGFKRWLNRNGSKEASNFGWRYYLDGFGLSEALGDLPKNDAIKTLLRVGLIINMETQSAAKPKPTKLYSIRGDKVRLYRLADDVLAWEPPA